MDKKFYFDESFEKYFFISTIQWGWKLKLVRFFQKKIIPILSNGAETPFWTKKFENIFKFLILSLSNGGENAIWPKKLKKYFNFHYSLEVFYPFGRKNMKKIYSLTIWTFRWRFGVLFFKKTYNFSPYTI